MKINIHRCNQAVHFVAKNQRGQSIHIDGSRSVGGEGMGMRPMEALLSSVATCAAIDVVAILQKQRQQLKDLQIEVEGDREEGKAPTPFTSIQMNFILFGKLDAVKAARAVELAVEKYCSVKESLDPSITVTYSFEIRA